LSIILSNTWYGVYSLILKDSIDLIDAECQGGFGASDLISSKEN